MRGIVQESLQATVGQLELIGKELRIHTISCCSAVTESNCFAAV